MDRSPDSNFAVGHEPVKAFGVVCAPHNPAGLHQASANNFSIFTTIRQRAFALAGLDERKRLSICEQFMFPFRPLVTGLSGARKSARNAGARSEI